MLPNFTTPGGSTQSESVNSALGSGVEQYSLAIRVENCCAVGNEACDGLYSIGRD